MDPESLTRRLFDAFNGGDVDAFLEACEPAVEIISLRGLLEDLVYRGHDGQGSSLPTPRPLGPRRSSSYSTWSRKATGCSSPDECGRPAGRPVWSWSGHSPGPRGCATGAPLA
jgi:hypothetical protein